MATAALCLGVVDASVVEEEVHALFAAGAPDVLEEVGPIDAVVLHVEGEQAMTGANSSDNALHGSLFRKGHHF